MTMTVVLCNSPDCDNVSRFYVHKTVSAQKAYFDSLAKKSYSCQTVPLGQSFRIKDSINNLMKYNYGWIDFGSGFRYYFSIRDYSMVSETMTDILYDLDCLTTAYNQIGIEIPRVSISRYNGFTPDITDADDEFSKISFPYNPMYWESLEKFNYFDEEDYPGVVFFAFLIWDNSANKFNYGFLKWEIDDIDKVFNGSWMDVIRNDLRDGRTFGFQLSDICNIAYCPFAITVGNSAVKSVDKSGRCYCETSASYFWVNLPASLKTMYATPTKKHVMYDTRRTPIFEPAIGEKVFFSLGVLCFSVSTISVMIQVYRDNPAYGKDDTFYPDFITLPCETIDVYVDSWAEYAYRQRQYDIELRNINAKSSLSNIGNSAVSGLVGGAVTGSIIPGIGTAVGAVAGLAVGAVSQAVGTGIQYYYGGKEQDVTDAMYQRATDTLSLVGNAGTNFIMSMANKVFVALLQCDNQTKLQYENDVNANGYYYANTVLSEFDFFPNNKKFAIQGDVEIKGAIPTAWKDEIAKRFANGMVIKHD